jgi:hypothetical protein
METNPDESLDRLFAAAREEKPDLGRAEFAFETRVLARIREDRSSNWFSWAWKMSPYFAALALAAGAWGYLQRDSLPDSESLAASLREGGLPALHYYLGADE